MEPGLVNRFGELTLYSLFPLPLHAGPYLLAWLLARHLDGARPHRRWIVFVLAGLVVLNNVEFGIPRVRRGARRRGAVGPDAAMCGPAAAAPRGASRGGSATPWRACWRRLRDRLDLHVGARAGSLPRLGSLYFYAHLYGLSGWGDLPTPTLGFHIDHLHLTYVATRSASPRCVRSAAIPDAHSPALMAWSGVFGLGIGGYYMGRSSPEVVPPMFSAWTLALALLAVAAIQQIAHEGRRPTVAHLAVFFGMGLAACSLAQTPAPWTQIERLSRTAAPIDVASPALKRILVSYGGGRPEAIA